MIKHGPLLARHVGDFPVLAGSTKFSQTEQRRKPFANFAFGQQFLKARECVICGHYRLLSGE